MWEKLNKVSVQVIVSIIVVIGSLTILTLLLFKPVPAENAKLLDILGGMILGSMVTGVIGWLFTQSKPNKPSA